MATIYYEKDADQALIKGLKIGIIGYGSQGHAHALNAKDSGCEVRVGLHEGSKSKVLAEAAGLQVHTVAELTQWADVLMFTVPDVPMRKIYSEGVEPHLRAGQTLLFAHGLNIHFKLITPPASVNIGMIAPKGPGHRLRHEYATGAGMPGLIAIHQDATGTAKQIALGYGWAIGCAAAGVLETTFKEETETDLFGEQVVLCGGLAALIKAGFDTLVEAGYQPEAAYFECLHETKLIVDLIYEGGLNYMRYSISETAEWGDYITGSKIITADTKKVMKEILAEIQSGKFTEEWVAESDGGYHRMNEFRRTESAHQIETVGAQLRSMMPFLNAKKVPQ